MTLDLRTALSAYARMINTLDIRHLEHLLADDFHYASQHGGPCVVLAQGGPDDLVATVVAEIAGYRISRIDLCVVLSP